MCGNSGICGMPNLCEMKKKYDKQHNNRLQLTYRHFERFRSLKLHVEERQENCEKC